MNLIKEKQKIKIIPDRINDFSTGVIVSYQSDGFVAEIKNPSSVSLGQEPEILISSEDFIILFNSKVNKIINNNVFFSITSKVSIVQKREYPRIEVNIPVLLSDSSGMETEGTIINLGGGGMQIRSSRKFNTDSKLNASFKLYGKKDICVLFKILRISDNNDKFVLSGNFEEISNLDKTSIIQFCFKHQLEIKYKK